MLLQQDAATTALQRLGRLGSHDLGGRLAGLTERGEQLLLGRSALAGELGFAGMPGVLVPAGALALASSPYLKGLRELWIWSGDLLHDGKKYVADAKERLQAALPNTAVIG